VTASSAPAAGDGSRPGPGADRPRGRSGHGRSSLSGRRLGLPGGLAVAVVAGLTAVGLVASGAVVPARLLAAQHPVRGVDVSSYQGRIDWAVIAGQGVDFAWIKSTEGSGSEDPAFARNWEDARRTDLVVGAYHFLSFDSPGETQADNVIATVPREPGTLGVAVDVELYGRYRDRPPSRARVRAILDPLLARLEEHYGRPPVLYVTAPVYRDVIQGAYAENPIWISSIVLPPHLADRRWTMWQHSHTGRLDGYDGVEPSIDLDVLDGDLDRLRELTLP
jgi:lysozyme